MARARIGEEILTSELLIVETRQIKNSLKLNVSIPTLMKKEHEGFNRVYNRK